MTQVNQSSISEGDWRGDDHAVKGSQSRSIGIGSPIPTRRKFVALLGLGLLSGCATQSVTRTMPGPVWPGGSGADQPPPAPSTTVTVDTDAPSMSGVVARSQWAKDKPAPALMNRMLPVRFITVHHDGMTPYYPTDAASGAARLETIRRSHRNKGWGDIGYHFAIDREGRVWEGRPLAWQGAHVKDHNEGNIGIVCLGNFDLQSPSPKQLAGLQLQISRVMRQYRVPASRIRTHQEWAGAATACPGRSLQSYMLNIRSTGRLG